MNKPVPYNQVKYSIQPGIMFRDAVFNQFISEDGGIVRGNMIALAGTSGAGKTTLCKKLQKELPSNMTSVFFSLETGKGSVARQTKRVETGDNALVCDAETFSTWTAFMDYLYNDVPEMVIVDSLQHAAKLLTKENGKFKYDNYAQVVEDLYTWKEKNNGIVIMIVQLNGQGKVEGPEATVFDVDCPLKLIADPKTGTRHLIASKNRMGGTVGTPIFYEFTSDDSIIKFFTEKEYEVIRQGVRLPDMIVDTISSFIGVYKNHDNYADFKKEFRKGCKAIYAKSDDNLEICSQTMVLANTLVNKWFK